MADDFDFDQLDEEPAAAPAKPAKEAKAKKEKAPKAEKPAKEAKPKKEKKEKPPKQPRGHGNRKFALNEDVTVTSPTMNHILAAFKDGPLTVKEATDKIIAAGFKPTGADTTLTFVNDGAGFVRGYVNTAVKRGFVLPVDAPAAAPAPAEPEADETPEPEAEEETAPDVELDPLS